MIPAIRTEHESVAAEANAAGLCEWRQRRHDTDILALPWT